jgi:hypothetical protein
VTAHAFPKPRTVALDLRDRPEWMLGIVLAVPGLVLEDEASGERVQPGGHPRPGCAHATARRAP